MWPPPPQGPGQGAPFYPAGAPQATIVPRTNRLAIVALVTGLCGLVVLAVGFAVAALVQAGRRGERGKGLAVGALVASAGWIVAVVITAAVLAGALVSADRDASGQVTGKDKVLPAALRVGDCFTGLKVDSIRTPVTALPCTEPHDGEVVGRSRLRDGAYPGGRKIHEQATSACILTTVRLLKSRHGQYLEPYLITPTKLSWGSGDRKVLCLLRYTGPDTISAPLARTLDPTLKYWTELAFGDCFGKWDSAAPAQRIVSCDRSHWSQVYAVSKLKSGPYPGEKALGRKADAGCQKKARKAFGQSSIPNLYSSLYPNRLEWDGGIRTIVCVGVSEGRPLKKSMLPR
ncbi:septum formation family protein [Actinomadura sp. 9N215]|uniref:DUF4190 domain-containing protein n=1 Tax=Actinomadura sp. 9N215 TaxID=3375150 RepID=UPI0037B80B26